VNISLETRRLAKGNGQHTSVAEEIMAVGLQERTTVDLSMATTEICII